jgi:hypothetical protein
LTGSGLIRAGVNLIVRGGPDLVPEGPDLTGTAAHFAIFGI